MNDIPSSHSFCFSCGERLAPNARFCSICAAAVRKPEPESSAPIEMQPEESRRKISSPLALGIFFFPYVFSWFTFRRGYSTFDRGISTAWMVLLLLAYGLVKPNNNPQSQIAASTASSPEAVPSVAPKTLAMQMVSLDFKWNKAGFDNVMEADFTITNLSDYSIKDIEITCTHFANSGTKIDSNTRTVYESVPAKGKKVIKNFNMGFIHSQVNSSSCQIEDFVLIN